MRHKLRLSLSRAARGALVWALSGISKQFLEGAFSEVRRSMARRGRWARYHEREAVGVRFGVAEARHEKRQEPDLLSTRCGPA